MMQSAGTMSDNEASVLALQALAFLAAAPDRLERFLALTGLAPTDLYQNAGTRDVQLAVLGHLMANESELLVFASEARFPPEDIARAHTRLSAPE